MRITKQQLRRAIREAYEDIQAIIMRVRVDIDDPSEPSLQDILTTLRGLPNVITVQQDRALDPAPDSKQMATLIVKFENSPAVDIPTLQMQVEALPTVDMVTIPSVDGERYDKDAADQDAQVSRDAQGQAFQKQRKLGKYAEDVPQAYTEGKAVVTKKRVQQIIKEEVSRKLNETAGGHFFTGLEHEHGIGLNAQEIAATMAFVNDWVDDEGFMTAYRKDPEHGYDVTPYEIFFGYYQHEMPYGTQKARDGDPYVWIFNKLRQELGLPPDPSMTEGLLREASIEVDWVGDVGELQSIPQNLSFELIDPSGPGGGAAVVVVTGEREALKDWYVWDYSAGDLHQDAGADFDEFVMEGMGHPTDYEPTNVDKVYEIIQPLLDASNVGADRQGEIAMEVAGMYDAMVDNPDEIYAHAEDILKTDAGYHDGDEEEEQRSAAGRPWEHN